jgi:hypothetical protein
MSEYDGDEGFDGDGDYNSDHKEYDPDEDFNPYHPRPDGDDEISDVVAHGLDIQGPCILVKLDDSQPENSQMLNKENHFYMSLEGDPNFLIDYVMKWLGSKKFDTIIFIIDTGLLAESLSLISKDLYKIRCQLMNFLSDGKYSKFFTDKVRLFEGPDAPQPF